MKPSPFASRAYAAYIEQLAHPRGRPRLVRKLRTGILRAMRALLVRAGDPIVAVQVERSELLMNISHPLPVYMACAPLYDRALPRIAAAVRRGHGRLTVIDVGANIGDSAALIAETVPDVEILCIEGSATYFPLLTANVERLRLRAECVRSYCGDGTPVRMAPSERGGTGRLLPGGDAVLPTATLDDLIAARPRFTSPHLLKVDTDGFDYRVLRGARGILGDARPLVYFELDPSFLRETGEDPLSIFPMLASLGYAQGLLYGNLGQCLGPFALADLAFLQSSFERIDGRHIHYFDVLAFPTSEEALFYELARSEAAATARTAHS